MIYGIGYDKWLVILPKNYSKDIFLRSTRVSKGLYGESVLKRIYECLTCNMRDIEGQYKKYYQQEYKDIWVFLLNRYCVSDEIISKIEKAYSDYILGLVEPSGNGDYNTKALLEKEEIRQILHNIIWSGKKHENTN